jgi:hypothetical protein
MRWYGSRPPSSCGRPAGHNGRHQSAEAFKHQLQGSPDRVARSRANRRAAAAGGARRGAPGASGGAAAAAVFVPDATR